MCGIAAIAGSKDAERRVGRMINRLRHRGPDGEGIWTDNAGGVSLGQRRLSILDLSVQGRQPMTSANGRFVLTYNGEVYNYRELRSELADYPFHSQTDTEVVLAAWVRWGEACLDRLIGMFAFVVWDTHARTLIAVRDRFGVKPLYVASLEEGGIALASEIKALHTAGVPATADPVTWSTYLATGLHEHSTRTFWSGVSAVPAGTILHWEAGKPATLRRWYDLAARVGQDVDPRSEATVREEYLGLLEDSVRLRFRSDVPVGINLSGGLDSSTLLGVVRAVQGADSDVKAFTFVCDDERYDELPWVQGMLEQTKHSLITCTLRPDEVPALAARMMVAQEEPFGGLPTLAYGKIFEAARAAGVIVLLDGQGMDEQWAGYDYYRSVTDDKKPAPIVQGAKDPAVRPECLTPDLRRLVEPFTPPSPFPDRLRNLQLRDALHTKIPRALRFNDRVSMAASTELREPFLDHRLFELAMKQPADRKIRGDVGKHLLREITTSLVPAGLRLAPKRALQTPQREWLRGPLRSWAGEQIEAGLAAHSDWFDIPAAHHAWNSYVAGEGDNSFWVWQWLSVGLAAQRGELS
ncbi:MAG: asparagine synthase (glutamine-hydrolyzing) [Deltaproteobacteria bacterium]|nr:asparagine synthase (glutamine-hydrolyzing) [Deltaproteobacteria bacterium]